MDSKERTKNVLAAIKQYAGDTWQEPLQNTTIEHVGNLIQEEEVLEWWNGDRKITMYIPDSPLTQQLVDEMIRIEDESITDDIFYIKVTSQVEGDPFLDDGILANQYDLYELWDWLVDRKVSKSS